ncbi:CUB domain-containing protein 2-like [Saccostrea cucullata]|uniref:CUB domain-containing protein 2-like n=1 Tax=Saccostrea cuccullata TaxID=36930 RepID=UPI002ED430F4
MNANSFLTFTTFTCISAALGKFEYTLLETIEDNQDRNLTSPGYPANYPNNVIYTCTWIIKTGYSAYVYFVIFFMDIKRSQTNQCNDYLEITQIDPCCHTPLKRCGQFTNIPILTKGNKIRVSFVSDRSETGKGFLLFWNVSFIPSSSPLTTTSKKQISTKN